jgi:hypothetical protein
MHTFTDAIGEEWAITLDTSIVRRLRASLGIDLLRIDDQATLETLITDDEKLVDVISELCTDQIRHRKLDEVGFAQRLIGDALDNACDALIDELVFISRRNRREVIAAAWNKTKAFQDVAKEQSLKAINSEEMDALIQKQIQDAIHGGMTSQNVQQSCE